MSRRTIKKSTAGSIILLSVLLSLQQVFRFSLALPSSQTNQDVEQSSTSRQTRSCFLVTLLQTYYLTLLPQQCIFVYIDLSSKMKSMLLKYTAPENEVKQPGIFSRSICYRLWRRKIIRFQPKCRLHRDNDLFRDQEQHKIHLDINHWQCGYCRKSFRAENFLDKHFDSRHYNLLNVSHGKCLADLCGALHCDLKMDIKSRKSKCKLAAAARNKHLCETLADSCFPINEGPSASSLHELFHHQFCEAHSCTGKQKPFSRGAERQPGIFYMASSNIDFDVAALFLCHCVFTPKRIEQWNRSA